MKKNDGLIKVFSGQVTSSGELILGKVESADTLYKVRRYKAKLIDGTELELTLNEYKLLEEAVSNPNMKFFGMEDGRIVALGQIKIVTYEDRIYDALKED